MAAEQQTDFVDEVSRRAQAAAVNLVLAENELFLADLPQIISGLGELKERFDKLRGMPSKHAAAAVESFDTMTAGLAEILGYVTAGDCERLVADAYDAGRARERKAAAQPEGEGDVRVISSDDDGEDWISAEQDGAPEGEGGPVSAGGDEGEGWPVEEVSAEPAVAARGGASAEDGGDDDEEGSEQVAPTAAELDECEQAREQMADARRREIEAQMDGEGGEPDARDAAPLDMRQLVRDAMLEVLDAPDRGAGEGARYVRGGVREAPLTMTQAEIDAITKLDLGMPTGHLVNPDFEEMG